MTRIYSDADYLSAHKQKQRLFWTFMGVTGIYLFYCVAWWIYFMGLPYEDPMPLGPQIAIYVATVFYAVFAWVFLSIKYARVRAYNKMLYFASLGLKVEETHYFYTFRDGSLPKDGVDTLGCVFESWNQKKKEWFERETYVDREKPLPPFDEGDLIHYITQGNFIVAYEILQKQVLEFEEVQVEEY